MNMLSLKCQNTPGHLCVDRSPIGESGYLFHGTPPSGGAKGKLTSGVGVCVRARVCVCVCLCDTNPNHRKQFPIALAFAITIHKAQGSTILAPLFISIGKSDK